MMTEQKPVIKNADMPDDMQEDAVSFAKQALDKFNIEKDIASFIKKVSEQRSCQWGGFGWHTGDVYKGTRLI